MQKYIRALRLLFIAASILPFALGSLIDKGDFSLIRFLIGLAAKNCDIYYHHTLQN